ncbi:MAG: hypothetical protein N2578_08500, partial [Bdellovibrionaceae bacterium]|nr:hypothetical protein [Pseudobdellovibrionaceae bacterium]
MGAEKVSTTPVIKPISEKSKSELFDLRMDVTDFGKADSLRYNILHWVLDERYDKAIEELRNYLEQPSEYPDFYSKVHRFVNHSIDLIYAIKAKRNFPGLNALTRSKQQELREKFKEHFRELGLILKKIEAIEKDLRITDARSTIHVVRALWISIAMIAGLGFFLDFIRGLGETGWIVVDDFLDLIIH